MDNTENTQAKNATKTKNSKIGCLTIILAIVAIAGIGNFVYGFFSNLFPDDDLNPIELKEKADETDSFLNGGTIIIDSYYGIMAENLTNFSSGASTIVDIYSSCEDLRDYYLDYSDAIDDLDDDVATDYAQAAKKYAGNLLLIHGDIMDYLDTYETSSLTSAEEGISLVTYYREQLTEARKLYLIQGGFSAAEIDELLSY